MVDFILQPELDAEQKASKEASVFALAMFAAVSAGETVGELADEFINAEDQIEFIATTMETIYAAHTFACKNNPLIKQASERARSKINAMGDPS